MKIFVGLGLLIEYTAIAALICSGGKRASLALFSVLFGATMALFFFFCV